MINSKIEEIYLPARYELNQVERLLKESLEKSRNKSVLEVSNYLLSSGGKRLRPALVILSAKAALGRKALAVKSEIINIASAVELVHIASLIHDDVIDEAKLRHNKPTIDARYGRNVAIALGDYLYSKAFELIASCGHGDILACIAQATSLMCEGELVQVCERDNLSLLRKQYLIIVKKKTASLFAASCQSGAMLSGCPRSQQGTFREYGLNFGIAFQIVDDCLDLSGTPESLGKAPGADFKMGELTLPVLNLLSVSADKRRIMELLKEAGKKEAFLNLRERFINSAALDKTRKDAFLYLNRAKSCLEKLQDTSYKLSLLGLLDYVASRFQPF